MCDWAVKDNEPLSDVGTYRLELDAGRLLAPGGDPALDPTPEQDCSALPMFFATSCYLLMRSVKTGATSCCGWLSCKCRQLALQ